MSAQHVSVVLIVEDNVRAPTANPVERHSKTCSHCIVWVSVTLFCRWKSPKVERGIFSGQLLAGASPH